MAANSKSRVGQLVMGVLFLALIAQSATLYPRLRGRNAEIANLRETVQALEKKEAERNAAKPQAVQLDELTRLRKDNQELHRLRNEVRQLRDASQQPAPAAPVPAAAPPTALVGQLQRQVQQLQAENAQLRAGQQQVLQVQAQTQADVGACINNLRQLDGAKQQWALENRQPADAVPEPVELEIYLADPAVWNCPAGGVYTLNAVGTRPTCGIPGHALP